VQFDVLEAHLGGALACAVEHRRCHVDADHAAVRTDHLGGDQEIGAGAAAPAVSDGGVALAAVASVLLGVGTALVYPTLIAAISDAVEPVARARVVGVYRFRRDMGYIAGGLLTGAVADALGFGGAIAVVAALTAASGIWVALDYPARSLAGRGILVGNAS
jgi:MFS family permease